MGLSPFVATFDQLILDLDGCVYVGDEPTRNAPEAIAELRAAGKRVAFVTNDPRHSEEEYVQRLWRMNIKASSGDVVTVGGAVRHLLAETRQGQSAFVIGTGALRDHVAGAGLTVLNDTDLASQAEVVVLGGTDDVHYDDLRTASLAVRRGADFLATGRDPTYPMPDGLWPGTGAILAAVELASGREAAIVGKPEPQLFLTAMDRMGDGATLAVGDKLDADIAAAKRVGIPAALVLTGGTSADAAAAAQDLRPDRIATDLAELVLG